MHSHVGIVWSDHPFVAASVTCLEAIKMVLMAPIALCRILVLLVLILPLLLLVCTLGTLGLDLSYIDPATHDRLPLSKCRRVLLSPIRPLIRCILFCFGFLWIEETFADQSCCCGGTQAHMIVSNHVCWIEPLYFMYKEMPCCVAKAELANSCLGRLFAKVFNIILVDRNSDQGRHTALNVIARRADPKSGFPPVLVFPEGTTHSESTLICFKRGAFHPLLPVQPVVVRYPFCNYDPAWVVQVGTVWHGFRMLCQVYNRMQVKYLAVEHPSTSEKLAAPEVRGCAYGARVRTAMAAASEHPKLVMTSHMYTDVKRTSCSRIDLKLAFTLGQTAL